MKKTTSTLLSRCQELALDANRGGDTNDYHLFDRLSKLLYEIRHHMTEERLEANIILLLNRKLAD